MEAIHALERNRETEKEKKRPNEQASVWEVTHPAVPPLPPQSILDANRRKQSRHVRPTTGPSSLYIYTYTHTHTRTHAAQRGSYNAEEYNVKLLPSPRPLARTNSM
mmetsp:Transcript_18482/g.37837  ORF Transcript_18482/g.37837 Transcript_18482/m.37837 type:complete len:106 (-) Transcript_18482:25-342(-)